MRKKAARHRRRGPRAATSETGPPNCGRARLLPSSFMRSLRPECYSDALEKRAMCSKRPRSNTIWSRLPVAIRLTILSLFCRRLCERVICPNLRPQTGPEGGDDSKADSETYPVAEEIGYIHRRAKFGEGAVGLRIQCKGAYRHR